MKFDRYPHINLFPFILETTGSLGCHARKFISNLVKDADQPSLAIRDTWSAVQSVLHNAISKQQLPATATPQPPLTCTPSIRILQPCSRPPRLPLLMSGADLPLLLYVACYDAPLLLVADSLTGKFSQPTFTTKSPRTSLLQRLSAHTVLHSVDFIGGDFNMSAFSTVGDVFSDPEFAAPGNALFWTRLAGTARLPHHALPPPSPPLPSPDTWRV